MILNPKEHPGLVKMAVFAILLFVILSLFIAGFVIFHQFAYYVNECQCENYCLKFCQDNMNQEGFCNKVVWQAVVLNDSTIEYPMLHEK